MSAKCFVGKRNQLKGTGLYPYWQKVWMMAAAFAAITLGVANQASAHRSPATCTANGPGSSITILYDDNAVDVKHGDEICIRVAILDTCASCCDITLLDTELVMPGGIIIPITVDASVPFGDSFSCPSADPRCASPSTCTLPQGQLGYKYIMDHADEHGHLQAGCPPNPPPGSVEVSAFLRSTAGTVHTAPLHGFANICQTGPIPVGHACCEPCTGTCTNVLPGDCAFPSVFTPDKSCDEVVCEPLDCSGFVVKCNDAWCNPATGRCELVPVPQPGCCVADTDCPADTKCVDSFCNHATADPLDNFCDTRPVPGCCDADNDCPADTKCVDSFCNHATANPLDNFCDTRPVVGCCDADNDCPADVKCVDSFCNHADLANPLDNFCDTRPIVGCCDADNDCPADTKCVDSFCNHGNPADPFDNRCDTRPIVGCCVADIDCPADTKCVDRFCNHANPANPFDNFCDAQPIVGCCDADNDCPADTKCVDSFCNHGNPADPFDNRCDTRPIVGCCDADNDCPADTKCVDSFCNHATADPLDNFCDTRPIVGCCDADNDCPADTKCVDSFCNHGNPADPFDNRCDTRPIAGCCDADNDCPGDTKCVDSFCNHADPANLFDNFCDTRPIVGCCDADNDCPADTKCVDSFCNHGNLADPFDNRCDTRPIAGCCDADNDCPADTKCVDSFCNHATADPLDNFCDTRPIAGCCDADNDCPPDTKCVDSFCNHADPVNMLDNFCDTRPIVGCCDADNDCPADTKCVDSFCNHGNPADPFDNRCDTRPIVGCCDADNDCPADTKCVDSFCNHGNPADPFDNRCDTRPIVGCCDADNDCPADTKCVDSFCNHADLANPLDNFCDTRPIVGCCDADNDCPADVKCVDSFCNHGNAFDPFDNRCDTRPVPGCCDADNDCPADTKCVDSFCNHATANPLDNFCDTRPVPGCCDADNDCPADTKCVDRFCNHANPADPLDNFCDTRPIVGCCDADSDCPADVKCVDSFCNHADPANLFDNFCATRPIVGCCDADNDCPADTTCVDSFCNHANPANMLDNFCDIRPILGCCFDDADCPPDPAECFESYCDLLDGLCKISLAAGGNVATVTSSAPGDPNALGQDDTALANSREEVPGGALSVGAERMSISEKGSLLYYSKIELRWNATAPFARIQDTFLTIVNDFPEEVCVQWYFINGDEPLSAAFVGDPPVLSERAHKGWNSVDCITCLTPDESTYYSAGTGNPLGCQPFSILDPGSPPGRPDPEYPGQRVLRGYAVAFAVDRLTGKEISWNHLSGHVDIVNYADRSAWEYNAFAFQCLATPTEGALCGGGEGQLDMNGAEYDFAFDKLLFDFYAVGSEAFSLPPGTFVITDTDLTLYPASVDLRQDSEGPVVTKAKFDVWNENEDGLSGTYRCIACWDQTLLCSYDAPNNFLIDNLHTNKGKARIDGMRSDVCNSPDLCCHLGVDQACFPAIDHPRIDPECSRDAALLGVADKVMYFSGAVTGRTDAGTNLVGQGSQNAVIRRDIIRPPEPLIGRDETPVEVGAVKSGRKPGTR